MPWFKFDDKAHSHPKWLKAGNAAISAFAVSIVGVPAGAAAMNFCSRATASGCSRISLSTWLILATSRKPRDLDTPRSRPLA